MSSWSSSVTFSPQFVQVYVPLPGFSPVVDISLSPINSLDYGTALILKGQCKIPIRI